jgi:hypothetical protein
LKMASHLKITKRDVRKFLGPKATQKQVNRLYQRIQREERSAIEDLKRSIGGEWRSRHIA